jgi:NAD(P)-dependent dehydrogenase (short-subunit alcohol dehydrogenase family)
MKRLEGKIAVVAGATRGAGRAIACCLGDEGATVICTGRSVRGGLASGAARPETIDETAELVTARGGRGVAMRVDHTVPAEVEALFARVQSDFGQLDVLVNDVWGGDELTEFGVPFWKLSPEKGRTLLERAVLSHVITSRYAVPLMLARGCGLVVEVTDGDNFGYRGNLYYDLVKISIIRLAFAMSRELQRHAITSLAVTPGFLRSEAMLDLFGVTEENWRDGTAKERHFIASETPYFVGRAIAHLAADPDVHRKTGRVFSSWNLAKEYGFTDVDGRVPDWGSYFEQAFGRPCLPADDAAYASWLDSPFEAADPSWPKE